MALVRVAIVALAALVFVRCGQAEIIEDFQQLENPSAGTIVSDPDGSGGKCLFLDRSGTSVEVFSVALEPISLPFSVSLDIFDPAKVVSFISYGPRWAIQGSANTLAVGIGHRPGAVDCRQQYMINSSALGLLNNNDLRDQPWSLAFGLDCSRQVHALDTDLSASVSGASGKWARWTFDISDNSIIESISVDSSVIYDQDSLLFNLLGGDMGGIQQLWISGSANGAVGLGGVYIDNIAVEYPAGSFLDGDADADGDVDIFDFLILKSNYGSSASGGSEGDFDADGDVDIFDFLILKSNYGSAQ